MAVYLFCYNLFITLSFSCTGEPVTHQVVIQKSNSNFPALSLLQFVCTVIAILLHYFYMSTFAWMFVEQLHIYRMLTEVRNINFGHMRFYYVVGWGIPAIITGILNHPRTASFPFPTVFTGQIQESCPIQDSYGCTQLLLSLQCFAERGQHQIMSSRSQPEFGKSAYRMSVAPAEVILMVLQ